MERAALRFGPGGSDPPTLFNHTDFAPKKKRPKIFGRLRGLKFFLTSAGFFLTKNFHPREILKTQKSYPSGNRNPPKSYIRIERRGGKTPALLALLTSQALSPHSHLRPCTVLTPPCVSGILKFVYRGPFFLL